jgi:hypothetical protein
MSKSSSFNDHSRSALAYVWGKYREYAVTSQKRKADISKWRLRVLLLGMASVILGAFGASGWTCSLFSGKIYKKKPAARSTAAHLLKPLIRVGLKMR